ncbi:MAG: MFS transporter [Candidatus Rokubacteria bacterium]|nr:MFS transporter [Candidatus Rokubacteria bacterium]
MTLPLSSVLTGQFFRVTSLNFFFFASVNAFLPLYIQRHGGTEAQIGVVMGMYNATGIFCQPLVGAWVDRLGRRPLMLFGVSLVVLASLGFALFASLPVFALLRALQGIGFWSWTWSRPSAGAGRWASSGSRGSFRRPSRPWPASS